MLHLEKHELLLKVLLLELARLLNWLWRLEKAALLVLRRGLKLVRGSFLGVKRLNRRLRRLLRLLLLK